TLVIIAIDNDVKAGHIVHVRFEGVNTPEPSSPSGSLDTIEHTPVSEASLREGLISLAETGCSPGSLEGYQIWKKAFDEGKAGYFSRSPADVVAAIQEGLEKQAK